MSSREEEIAEEIETALAMDYETYLGDDFGCPKCGCHEFYAIDESYIASVEIDKKGKINVTTQNGDIVGHVILCKDCDWRYWYG